MLGIIGTNGAGKSTLLKAISGIMEPTEGYVHREGKMREIIEGGATTILVSHSLPQIREMCTKVLWLHKGKQVEFGDDVQGICDRYQEMLEGERKV